MILSNETIELRPFILEKDNNALKEQYLNWFTYDNVQLINSYDLFVHSSLNFIEESFKRFSSSTCQGFFIYDKRSKQFLGTLKLDKIDMFRRSTEIGLMIGESSFQGKQVGTQVMQLIIDYSFNVLGLHRIWGGTSEYNKGMITLFKKYNFTEEGRFKDANYISGKYSDNIYFGLIKKEYVI